MIPLQYKNLVMEAGLLNMHDDEHFSNLSSPLYDQVLFILTRTCSMCYGASRHDWSVRTYFLWLYVVY